MSNIEDKLPDTIIRGDNINLELTVVSPEDGNKSQLTAISYTGSKVVDVVNGSLFAAGDLVELRNLPFVQENEVDSVDVNEVTLKDPLRNDFNVSAELVNVDVPQDLTGTTITFTMKKSLDIPDLEASLQVEATILDQITNTGKAYIELAMDVESGKYWYDIELIDSGVNTTLVRAQVEILQDITLT